MMGMYMLMAFALGFWCIWSSNRDVKSLIESLVFTILAIIVKAVMTWSGFPEVNSQFSATWGILFLYTILILELVNRYSSNMSVNLTIAVAGALGWFFLAQWVFSKMGQAKIAAWLA